jgi:hypothetical protein
LQRVGPHLQGCVDEKRTKRIEKHNPIHTLDGFNVEAFRQSYWLRVQKYFGMIEPKANKEELHMRANLAVNISVKEQGVISWSYTTYFIHETGLQTERGLLRAIDERILAEPG